MSPLSRANPNLHTSSLMPTTRFANPNPMSWPTSTNVKLGQFLVRSIVARLDIIEMKSLVFVVVFWRWATHMALESGNHMALERVATTWPACAIVIMLMQYIHSYKNSRRLNQRRGRKKRKKLSHECVENGMSIFYSSIQVYGKKLVI